MNRFWQLDAYPEGTNFASGIKLRQEAIPEIGSHQLLVRNHWLSLDAGTRMWLTPRTDSYMDPTPLGSKIMGFILGEVIESRHQGYKAGDMIRAYGQWADYSVIEPDLGDIWIVDDLADMRQHFAVLGPNGWTAYVGLTEYAKVRPGETVLVSAAAGATGLLAVQFAKAMGCRVIGIAGGPEKCAHLTGHYGIHAAIDYKSENLSQRLAELAPDGVDCFFDCVGGETLNSVLPAMAMNGRIAICGLISTYDQTIRSGPENFDLILMKRLTVAGFFSPDFYFRGAEINRLTAPWLASGQISMDFDVSTGLEQTLTAYAKLFSGGNIGKVMVDLRAA